MTRGAREDAPPFTTESNGHCSGSTWDDRLVVMAWRVRVDRLTSLRSNGHVRALEWPFYLDVGSTRYFKYPFSMFEAFYRTIESQKMAWLAETTTEVVYDEEQGRNVPVEVVTEVPEMDATRVPSMACPDCAAYDGPFQSFGFNVSGLAGTNRHPMFPGLEVTRERFFLPPNQVIAGPVLTQKRVKDVTCTHLPSWSSIQNYYSLERGGCLNLKKTSMHPRATLSKAVSPVAYDEAPFGYDPTFLQTSALYRSTNEAKKSLLYVSDEEVDVSSGVPYGFFYDQGAHTDGVYGEATLPRPRPRCRPLRSPSPPRLSFPWSCSALSHVTRR